ncbi:YiiX/YebB-like N1pC/P60 family cysteine hydrolase [Halomonas sp. LS-001]
MMLKNSWVSTTVAIFLLCIDIPLAAANLPTDARPGDLIFREGTELVSNAVLALDNGTYSHVGILDKQDDQWVVIHSAPAENSERIDGVVVDPLDFFISPERSQRFSVYQVLAEDNQRQLAVQWAMAQKGTPFRIIGKNAIYCTTLVWKAWQTAGVNLEVNFTKIFLPFATDDYLLPSGLLSSPRLTQLMH